MERIARLQKRLRVIDSRVDSSNGDVSSQIIWISYPGILDVASGNACRLEGELRGYRWPGKGRQSVKLVREALPAAGQN